MARTRPADSTTPFPDSPLTLPMPNLSEDQWKGLEASLNSVMKSASGARKNYDYHLDLWNAIYEMRSAPKNNPWPGAANVVTPDITASMEEMVSRLCGSIFQERLFTIRGNDPIAGQFAHTTEQFYNNESDENKWPQAFEDCFWFGARDGVGICELWWDQKVREEVRVQSDGTRMLLRFVEYDAPRPQAVEARDFRLIPAHAPSIEAADGVARKVYMTEADMWKMVEAGIFRKDKVEAILSWVPPGAGELSQDPDGVRTYTMSNLIDVVDNATDQPPGIKMQRGPVEMWRINTRQYDLYNHDKFDEFVIWQHESSMLIAGVAPFEYWRGRPYKVWSPFPRRNRFYGQGVIQRLKSLGEEKNAQRNARLNWLDYALNPMRWKTKSAKFPDGKRWGPGGEVEGVADTDWGFYRLGDYPQSALMEEEQISRDMDRAVGGPNAAPQSVPVGGNQQRSARAAQIEMFLRSQMMNSLIRGGRRFILECFEYMTGLYQQYGPDTLEVTDRTGPVPKTFRVPKDVLALDYSYGVVGMGGPLDKDQRRQDMMLLVQILGSTPLVGSNLGRLWNLLRMLIETFDVPEVTALIGSFEEAQQQSAQMAKAAEDERRQQLMLTLLQHANANKLTQQNGQRRVGAQPAAPPQPAQPPQAMSALNG